MVPCGNRAWYIHGWRYPHHTPLVSLCFPMENHHLWMLQRGTSMEKPTIFEGSKAGYPGHRWSPYGSIPLQQLHSSKMLKTIVCARVCQFWFYPRNDNTIWSGHSSHSSTLLDNWHEMCVGMRMLHENQVFVEVANPQINLTMETITASIFWAMPILCQLML